MHEIVDILELVQKQAMSAKKHTHTQKEKEEKEKKNLRCNSPV